MPGGAEDGGSPSKKFVWILRSKSCPPRILGPKPYRYFQTPFARKIFPFEKINRECKDSDSDVAIGDFFATPKKQKKHAAVELSTSNRDLSSARAQYDVSPEEVQSLLDDVSSRLRVAVELGILKEKTDEETA
jgi:hypothetical protein